MPGIAQHLQFVTMETVAPIRQQMGHHHDRSKSHQRPGVTPAIILQVLYVHSLASEIDTHSRHFWFRKPRVKHDLWGKEPRWGFGVCRAGRSASPSLDG